jgi:xanthine dehydrogenase accessory factor
MSRAAAFASVVAPERVDLDAAGGDNARAYELLAEGARAGLPGALLTLVEIVGGAPRPLGTHMAVLADGRYCGYISGSCAEAAIARETLGMIERDEGGLVRVGRGSPWIDVVLPCGGGLALDVLVRPDPFFIAAARAAFAERRHFSASLGPVPAIDRSLHATGRHGGLFHRDYLPEPRLLIFGGGREAIALVRLARAGGLGVHLHATDLESGALAEAAGATSTHCRALDGELPVPIDRRTAIVLLDHDHEREFPFLASALGSDAFYIGALGSERTHALRKSRLGGIGMSDEIVARIHAPIGLVPRTRESRSLALSILAEIVDEAAKDALTPA